MKRKIFLISVLLYLSACSGPQDYSQTYVILMNRNKVGTEIVNEKTDKKGNRVYLAEQEINISPNSKDKNIRIIRTKTVIGKGDIFPSSYSYDSNNGTNYDLKIEDGEIIRIFKNQEDRHIPKIPFNSKMLMFDLSVYHTVDYWIQKYNINKGGQQSFKTYLLPAGSVVNLVVSLSETPETEYENDTKKLKHFEIVMDNEISILLWTDQNSRLYRLFINGPNIEVIRSDIFSKLEEKLLKEGKTP